MCAILVGLAAGACAPAVHVDEARLARAAPRTLAVLPFELSLDPGVHDDDGELARRADALRLAVARRLSLLPYRTLEPARVDEALAAAGLLDRTRAARAPASTLGRALGVDAVVRGRVRTLSNVEGVVLFFHTVAADLQVVDVRAGEVLARVSHAERAIGGFLPESQQAVRAILTTVENSTEAGFLRLAERFAEALERVVPAPDPLTLAPSARLDAARVEAPGRPLVTGDVVVVLAEGTAGAEVVADLGPALRGVPLDEVAPGRYRGAHVVGPGEVAAGPVVVRLRDRFGDGAWRLADPGPVVIDARGPAAASALRADALPATGLVRLSWRAAPGAVRYRLHVLGGEGPVVLGETEVTFTVVPACADRVGVAGLDALGNLGPSVFLPLAGPAPGGP